MRVTMMFDVSIRDGGDVEVAADALSLLLQTAVSTPGVLDSADCKNVSYIFPMSFTECCKLLRCQPEVAALKVVTFSDILGTLSAEDTPENREVIRCSYEVRHFEEMRHYDWEWWYGIEGLKKTEEDEEEHPEKQTMHRDGIDFVQGHCAACSATGWVIPVIAGAKNLRPGKDATKCDTCGTITYADGMLESESGRRVRPGTVVEGEDGGWEGEE